ncbi:hypothetical protein T02_3473 [Trichinella nativa]|uniref:Uncharacterized protein n=1 Tax=Trichinella nativa TaxID=6335 RepID=A0A0V1KH47_9BILA|nr:hypothetical protein T02_3473 [Trichinella nativa]
MERWLCDSTVPPVAHSIFELYVTTMHRLYTGTLQFGHKPNVSNKNRST